MLNTLSILTKFVRIVRNYGKHVLTLYPRVHLMYNIIYTVCARIAHRQNIYSKA